MNRRKFLRHAGAFSISPLITPSWVLTDPPKFHISLAQFSLAGSLFSGRINNMSFPEKAVHDFGITAVEYVSIFWRDKSTDQEYLRELKQRTDDLGVKNVLIMVDFEGELGSKDKSHRLQAVENHYKWIDAAKFLGCDSIRVNMEGDCTPSETMKYGLESYLLLLEYGEQAGIHVLIENHMNISTNPDWLSDFLGSSHSPYSGCLPDFGNFTERERITELSAEAFRNAQVLNEFDKYEGIKKLMPYAVGVSAKTISFDDFGNCLDTDFDKMMPIVLQGIGPKFKGFIGIEYSGAYMAMMGAEGNFLSEDEGIRATLELLKKWQ